MSPNSAAIILAAGAATRMGRLKQLLPYGPGTLLQHSIQQAQQAGFDRIVVVLGAEAALVQTSLSGLSIATVQNDDWAAGMGSSIAAGMRFLKSGPTPDLVAILLGDQPLVESRHLEDMSALLASSPASIVAAEYNGTLGVPAFFKPELFAALSNLPPDAGARYLLRNNAQVVRFPLPEAALDIDTPADFSALTSGRQK